MEMRSRSIIVVIAVLTALLALATSAYAQALFAWEQARMEAAARQRAAIEASPYYQAQAYQWGWRWPELARPDIWLERPLRGYEDWYGLAIPERSYEYERWYERETCREPQWEVIDRWYQIVPYRPYYLRSGRIERDRCVHDWLLEHLRWRY